MTAPYLPDAADHLATPQGHLARVELSHPDHGTIPVPVAADDLATVVFDEASAPRVTAQLAVPLVAGVGAVDARAGWRLEVSAGYRRPDGIEDVHQLADLGVRRSPRQHASGLLQLAARSDEALVIDAAPAVAESLTAATPADAVAALLAKSLGVAPYIAATLPTTGPAVTIEPIDDRWAALVDLADRHGAQVYDDGTRTWHVAPQPSSPAATPAHVLRCGDGGTVLETDEDTDRDAWANYVLLRYRWRTDTGEDKQLLATAYASSGPYAITGPAGRRIFRDDREVATTQPLANLAAAQVLTRAMSRAETMTVRAVAAYWLRPGHTVDVVQPDGRSVRHLVARVAFDLARGLMEVTTRLPAATIEVATTTPPPDPATPTVPKPPVPDPAPPTRTAYVSEWAASSTASYRGNGTKRTDTDPGDAWQGMFSGSFNGNQRSLALFTAANSAPAPSRRGETGKTMTQAFGPGTGATVSRVELIATVEHTWANPPRGADIRIGYYNGIAAPASGLAPKPYVTSADWPKGSGPRVVNVTRADLIRDLADGSARGLTFGPGATTSTDYYARLINIRCRVHYAK